MLVVVGQRHLIRAAVLPDGSSPASEFYASLGTPAQEKYWRRLDRYANTGTLAAPEQVNALEDGLFEFKLEDGSRLVAFHAGSRERGLVVLTHGFVKKSRRTPPIEIARAQRIRREMR